MNLHGAPRATQDLDVLLRMDEDNLTRAVQALLDLGFQVRIPVDPLDFAREEIREQWIVEKNMRAFTFYHPERELQSVDLLFGLSLDYEDGRANFVTVKAGSITIPLLAIDDLIRLKKDTGRDIDEFDIKMLERVKELSDEP